MYLRKQTRKQKQNKNEQAKNFKRKWAFAFKK